MNTPINTEQNPTNVALLYPAPCVVMAVPYNTSTFLLISFSSDPDSFPEAMWVQLPDHSSRQPVLLPVVRMGCDTALVVIPPKNRTVGLLNVMQGKTTPVPNRGNTVGVCFVCAKQEKRFDSKLVGTIGTAIAATTTSTTSAT